MTPDLGRYLLNIELRSLLFWVEEIKSNPERICKCLRYDGSFEVQEIDEDSVALDTAWTKF